MSTAYKPFHVLCFKATRPTLVRTPPYPPPSPPPFSSCHGEDIRAEPLE